MRALFDEVQKQAQQLTVQEKAALAQLLIDELDSFSETENVEQLWIAESQRRYEAYLKGELTTVMGDEAMANARNRLT
jgi:putative addiction module component (TIGR02574 family)